MDVARDSLTSEYMEECEFYQIEILNCSLMTLTVYCVNWLHAKAKHDWWQEEYILIQAEMEWTQIFFQHRADEWAQWQDLKEMNPGHMACAEQQISMWMKLKSHAKSSFEKV